MHITEARQILENEVDIAWDDLDTLAIVGPRSIVYSVIYCVIVAQTEKAIQLRGDAKDPSARKYTAWFPKSAFEPAQLSAYVRAYRERDPEEVVLRLWFVRKMTKYHEYVLGIASP